MKINDLLKYIIVLIITSTIHSFVFAQTNSGWSKNSSSQKTVAKHSGLGDYSKPNQKKLPRSKSKANASEKNSSKKSRLDYDTYSQQLEQAAANGDVEAQFALGWMYLNGEGVKENNTTAAYWMQKAANKGNVNAYTGMGVLWENGIGVDSVDISKAMVWYQKAADKGEPYAQCSLGNIFKLFYHYSLSEGNIEGANDAGLKAYNYYVKSANQDYAPAMYKLGLMYANGEYVAQDDNNAVQWFHKGAQQDDEDCVYAIGYFMRNERGGLKNDEELAFKCFQFASEHGNSAATNELGLSYQFGSGVAKDERKAVTLYARAAENGYDEGAYNWAYCNYFGIGVERPNQELALKVMEDAADNGNMNAVDFMCEYQNQNFGGEGMVSVANYTPKNSKRCNLRGATDHGPYLIAVSNDDDFIRLDFQLDVSQTIATTISRDTWIRDNTGALAQLVYAQNIKIYPGKRWHGRKVSTFYFSLYFHRHSIKGNKIDFAEFGSDRQLSYWQINEIPLPGKRDKDKLDW